MASLLLGKTIVVYYYIRPKHCYQRTSRPFVPCSLVSLGWCSTLPTPSLCRALLVALCVAPLADGEVSDKTTAGLCRQNVSFICRSRNPCTSEQLLTGVRLVRSEPHCYVNTRNTFSFQSCEKFFYEIGVLPTTGITGETKLLYCGHFR